MESEYALMFATSDVLALLLDPYVIDNVRTLFKEMRSTQEPRIKSAKNEMIKRCTGGRPIPAIFI